MGERKYNFGGSHLEIQDGHHAKCILLYSSPKVQYRKICLLIAGVQEKEGSIHKLFCGGHFEIQDGHHIGYNLAISFQRLVMENDFKVCVYCDAQYCCRMYTCIERSRMLTE